MTDRSKGTGFAYLEQNWWARADISLDLCRSIVVVVVVLVTVTMSAMPLVPVPSWRTLIRGRRTSTAM